MAESVSSLQTKILRRKTSQLEYDAYRAGLEWDLADPIVIEKREDLKSEHRWRDSLDPFHHQVTNLITFCRRLPVTLLADDVGLGKTISAGLIISELVVRSRLTKILIVCPKLLGPQWKEELQSKFNIESEIATGKELIEAEPEGTGAIITTYNSARLYLNEIPHDRFQMLILDEAHKLRNLYGVEKPPQVAKRFRQALEDRRFRFVLMLTATPIQNRLWDLYSLVDLLTVARGHKNPFGSEGMFARKFIADNREQARQLKPEAREEFRSIVYGYMSRVRRGDAKLYFPERIVQMHKVVPTHAELELIAAIAKPIQKLNRLSQISILKALTSSPHALMAQLNNMARNGTVPQELASVVRDIVSKMPTSAKLIGLGELIERLKQERPERWRLVVFTTLLETQVTIQSFLEDRGLKVGIINGTSGSRNQETIKHFKKNPPDCHVIVSTEAGSEGVNLQVANVLVNFDLPWNPMIVEQRIGRVQRLASEHASVGIFNIMLKGTFEEYIVGRLMEKLQMASHAIGDIEALLEASGINGEDEKDATSFDEKIRQLVVAALAGKNVEQETRLAEESIANAKKTLEQEEGRINAMLGSMDGAEYVGPRAPTLPSVVRRMNTEAFTLAAFQSLGARITPQQSGVYLIEENGHRQYIRFTEENVNGRTSTYYGAGTPAFLRLVDRIIATGVHDVEDLDQNPARVCDDISHDWIGSFGGRPKMNTIEEVRRCFEGIATVRVRATVAHDSYERLVEIACNPSEHHTRVAQQGLNPLSPTIETSVSLGINTDILTSSASLDPAISEFCRFYLERRYQEMKSAGDDERKRKKLEDEFTPRLEMTLVAVEGRLYRELKVRSAYSLEGEFNYESTLSINPYARKILEAPEFGLCAKSGKSVPKNCLKQCAISGMSVLQHLLTQSELSSRFALPEFVAVCSLSGKRILKDEAELSAMTNQLVAKALLKTSAISGKSAEPGYFSRCEFTQAQALETELATSELSGKRYRIDEQMKSILSGKTGHKQEFVICHETRQPIAMAEAERCEVTGYNVRPGILKTCAITGKKVLPSELERCSVTGKQALRSLMVTSNLSQSRILEQMAVRSSTGNFCTPIEAKPCLWSGRKYHPDDLRVCTLTGLTIHVEFATSSNPPRLQALVDLLNGVNRTADEPQLWENLTIQIATTLRKGRCRVEASLLSPDKRHLAVCSELRTLLGLRIQQLGLIYAINENFIVGRIAQGRRSSTGWSEVKR